MNETLAILRERLAKAESRVLRTEKALETARAELSDLQTALRVMEGITGEAATGSSASSSVTMSDRQSTIVQLLDVGQENGSPPADLFKAYTERSGEEISIDTFRTTIWRMKGAFFKVEGRTFLVHGDNGVYWKEAAVDMTGERGESILGAISAPNENEPESNAPGSDAVNSGAPPLELTEIHSNEGR